MKKKNLKRQVIERLEAMAAYGHSKHEDKKLNGGKPAREKIYSIQTMHNYRTSAVRFAVWAGGEGCRTLEEARSLTGQYLQKRMDEGKSAWTVRLDAAALAKLYQVKTTELGVDLPSRRREDIVLHRTKSWKGHFSEENNRDLVDFCRSTGLRRCEVAKLRPEDVTITPRGGVTVRVPRGKGGKKRDVVALSDVPWKIAEAARAAGIAENEIIFKHIPHRTPCHEYRAQYAREMYARLARDPATLPRKARYCAHGDRVGQWYDRAALRVVSKYLGHSRLDVMMSYLR